MTLVRLMDGLATHLVDLNQLKYRVPTMVVAAVVKENIPDMVSPVAVVVTAVVEDKEAQMEAATEAALMAVETAGMILAIQDLVVDLAVTTTQYMITHLAVLEAMVVVSSQ